MTIALVIFLLSLATCLHLYVVYPALLFVTSRVRPKPLTPCARPRPSMSIVVPAHDEERVMAAKLHNTLALRYPSPQVDIVVASDGSTDGTTAIVRRFQRGDARIRLLDLPRCGKVRALNAAVAACRGDVVVFTDANSLLAADALEHLAGDFADPEVGGVCGNKKYRTAAAGAGDTTGDGENLYWRYDKWQKALESRIGSVFAADGALHALRRELYVPIDDPAQADDLAISSRVVLQGYRLIYDQAAVAWEEAPTEGRREFARKVRVTNHSVRALINLGPALWDRGFYSLELVSHKLLRHLAPFFLIALFASNAGLARVDPLFAAVLVAQTAFYVLAVAGLLLRSTRLGHLRVLSVPYYFTMVNAAALLGVLSIAAGRRLHAWTPRAGLRGAAALAVAVALTGEASAQTSQRTASSSIDTRIGFTSLVYDNFFQAPDGEPSEQVWAPGFDVRVSRRRAKPSDVMPFVRLDVISFQGLNRSVGILGGVRRDQTRHGFAIEGGFEHDRPRFDVGDDFARADIVGTDAAYIYRPTRAIQLSALGDYHHETYDRAQSRDNHVYNVGGAIRLRDERGRFSPEFGLLWGQRDVIHPNEDYDQRQWFIQVRSDAIPRTYLSARYRGRFREYTIGPAIGSNLAREDTRHQWTGLADVAVTRRLIANLYYAFEDADSTRPSRRFQTQTFGVGATVVLGANR